MNGTVVTLGILALIGVATYFTYEYFATHTPGGTITLHTGSLTLTGSL